MTSLREPHKDTEFEVARHVAAHAIAHLHMGQSFRSVGAHAAGWWEVIEPIWGTDQGTNARVALAGPCLDLAVALVEEDGDFALVGSWLETWRDDVASRPQGYRHDMVDAGAVRGARHARRGLRRAFIRHLA